MKIYLPKMANVLDDIDKLQKKFSNKEAVDNIKLLETEALTQIKDGEFKSMKFALNTLHGEVLIIKKIARPETLAQIQKSQDKIKNI